MMKRLFALAPPSLIGFLIGALLWWGWIEYGERTCTKALVDIKSFDVCIKLPGCFFDAQDVFEVGRAIHDKEVYCDGRPN